MVALICIAGKLPHGPVRGYVSLDGSVHPIRMTNAFRDFKTLPDIIFRWSVMVCIRFPLSLRNVEELLHERRIDISHDAMRWWRGNSGRLRG